MATQSRGLALALVVALALLTLMAAPSVKAGDQPKTLANAPGQSQVFNGDLTVGDEEIVRGDVVVYSGDVTVEDGGRIQGNVAVYSGDVTVAEGGVVDGDVTAWSGDVAVDGTVNGSISAASGTIELGPEAKVAGDISVMSGRIEQQAGAYIGGSLLRGLDAQIARTAGAAGARSALEPGASKPRDDDGVFVVGRRRRFPGAAAAGAVGPGRRHWRGGRAGGAAPTVGRSDDGPPAQADGAQFCRWLAGQRPGFGRRRVYVHYRLLSDRRGSSWGWRSLP